MTLDQIRAKYDTVWTGDLWRSVAPEPPQVPPLQAPRLTGQTRADRILAALPGPMWEILERTQLTYDQVQPCLTQLVKAGWVEKVGGGGMTRYRRLEAR
jgi:hypothetical protein